LAFEQLDRAPPDPLGVATVIIIVGAWLTVRGALGQEVVDRPEHCVRHCHHGFLVPPMPHDAAIPRPQRATLDADPGPRGFDQDRAEPAVAELRVAVPVGMLLEVLEVEQFERDAGFAPLGVKVSAVRPWSGALARGPRRVQSSLEGLVGQALDVGPPEAGGAGPPLDPGHRPQPDAQALGHLPMGPPRDIKRPS
jgi:hypothetical protein